MFEYAIDLISPFGEVSSRRMFGGGCIYLDGLTVALVSSTGDLFLKADKLSENEYISIGARQFSYERENKTCYLNYWELPAEAQENSQEFEKFLNFAKQAALKKSKK